MVKKRKVSLRERKRQAMLDAKLEEMPGVVTYQMYYIRDNLWKPRVAKLITANEEHALAWIERCQRQGFVFAEEVDEEQQRMRVILKAASKDREPKPEEIANKTSGYGQKPSRRPTRDYKGAELRDGTVIRHSGRVIDRGPAK